MMTSEEFIERYKGRRVRANERVVDKSNVGRTGVVLCAYADDLIELSMDDWHSPNIFNVYKLDVLDEKLLRIEPLPLPG